MDGRYDYKASVMNSDYGLRVAAKLDRVRESDFSSALNGVYGEFAEIFLQRFDFQTVSTTLKELISRNLLDLRHLIQSQLERGKEANRRVLFLWI